MTFGPLRAADEKQSADPFEKKESNSTVAEDPVFKVVPDASGKPYFPKECASYYTAYLAAMKEPSLMPGPEASAGEALRFTWLRSFHDPIAIRVWQVGTDFHIRAVRLKLQQDLGPGTVASDSTRILTPDELKEVKRLTCAKSFWSPLNDTENLAMAGGLDGSHWIFEHRLNKAGDMIDLWTPKDYGPKQYKEMGVDLAKLRDFKAYVSLGLYLLKITQLTPAMPSEIY